MPEFTLHPVDLSIIILYLLSITALGIWLGRKHKGAEDYFLAGRSMLWPFIGISLFASNISSTTLIGLAGDAYHTGISVFNYEWMASVVLVFFAIFLLPFVLRARVYTMPEYLEKRFDRRARRIFSLLTLFLNIIVDTAGSLYAGGLFLKLIFPDIPLQESILVLAIVAGLYTIAGGLAAVIYTDAIQAVLLLIGSIAITFMAFNQIESWDALQASLSGEMLSLVRPLSDPALPWLGLITGVPLLGFYFWCTNQFMAQRVLSAKNVEHGRWGVLLAALLKLPVLFIMVLPGTLAIELYPGLENPDMVYPTLLFDLMPVGLLGIVVAGFIAALMSQIDSTLNSASTLVTMDFIRPAKPHLSQRDLMRIGRLVTFAFMVLAALWAPQIESFGSLFKYLQKVLSYCVAPVVALYLIGIFWKKANAQSAWLTLCTGIAAGAGLFIANEVISETPFLHFLYVAPVLFALSASVMIIHTRLSPPNAQAEAQASAYTWTPAYFREESKALRDTPWYQNYRILSVLLLALTTWIVISYW